MKNYDRAKELVTFLEDKDSLYEDYEHLYDELDKILKDNINELYEMPFKDLLIRDYLPNEQEVGLKDRDARMVRQRGVVTIEFVKDYVTEVGCYSTPTSEYLKLFKYMIDNKMVAYGIDW